MSTGKYGLRVSTPISIGCIILCLGLLAAIFFPVFATAHSGSGSRCPGKMKSLGMALAMYAQDYDDRLPRASDWMDATSAYTNWPAAYHCPDLRSSHPADFGHAFNTLFTEKASSRIENKATALLLSDSNDLRWNANSPGHTDLAYPPRHFGGDNCLFADGHLKLFKFPTTEEASPDQPR